jgi:Tfp pilus assembly protein PilF
MDRLEKLKELLQAAPDDAFLKHAMALEWIKQGMEADARRLLEEILERDPGYTGSYYQLARLLERTGETVLALQWYEKGMAAAKAAGEQRTYNELKAAHEDLLDN